MNHFQQLLQQAQGAHSSQNWSLLAQCLQQLILESDSKEPHLEANRLYLLELALEVLYWGDFQQRWGIAKVFRRLGTIAVSPLIAIMEAEDAEAELCWYVMRILGEFNHPDVINALVQLLQQSESEELRAMAATALGQIGSNAIAKPCAETAIASLTELLTQEHTRLSAVQALAYIRNSATIDPLLTIVEDTQTAVRVTAIEALSSFHDSRIPPVLLTALNDVAAPVRLQAVKGLGMRVDLREELDLVQRLSARLYDFNLDVCFAAASALSRMGTDEAAANLHKVLLSQHTPLPLQIEIIRALSWLGTISGLEYLQDAMYSVCTNSPTLAQEIVTVLGRVESHQLQANAAEILISLLKSQHPIMQLARVKQAVALSLGQLGQIQAIESLICLLADSDITVRLHAIAALKNLAPETAHRQLQQLASNTTLTPDLQQGVAIALAEW